MNKDFMIECADCSNEPRKSINVARMIGKLDSLTAKNDLKSAEAHLKYWENEARSVDDTRGLIAVLNEEIGLYRRLGEAAKATVAVREALELLGDSDTYSSATVLVNAATTLAAFGKASDALPIYERAEAIYRGAGRDGSYEYAAMLNNKSSSYSDLGMFDDAEKCCRSAIVILKALGSHDGEIAVTLVNLAHIADDRGSADAEIGHLLDEAWEYIVSPTLQHDANYAFILSKLAPSYRHFGRLDEADACEAVSDEIYGGEA